MRPATGVLPRDQLAGGAVAAARRLLGCTLVHEDVAVRIVEVEAYEQDDPASHAARGRTTANATMFGPPGHAYVYFTYGMHHCVNVSTGPEGHGAAVLVRAGRVVAGVEQARGRRPGVADHLLAAGPARLTTALGIDRRHDGFDLCAPASRLRLHDGVAEGIVVAGPRVGVRLAADVPWRFHVEGAPEVSRHRRHPRARPPA